MGFFKGKEPVLPPTATGVKQTIQARHGTATFVPKGHTVTVINTYGRQTVGMWGFALHAPPTKEEWEEDNKEEEEEEEVSEKEKEKESVESSGVIVDEEAKGEEVKDAAKGTVESAKDTAEVAKDTAAESAKDAADTAKDTAEAAKDTTADAANKAEATAKGWSSYIPSVRRGKQPATDDAKPETPTGTPEKAPKAAGKGWSSYLPSVGGSTKKKTDGEQRTWGSYMSSGQGFTSAIPKGSLSSFTGMHQRDSTKSVAEQLYDFSKTPVGAAGISMASGSGYASSIYAAYSAYSKTAESARDANVGMEFLSMPHTRASTQHVSPKPGDTLVTNLRAPLLTLVEDSSSGAHDTLIAACDPLHYRELGVEKWESHGSCAENLVLTLGELNQRVGLKGRKAIGCDVAVNSVPAPLNLFMNVQRTEDGALEYGGPQGKRGEYVKLRAERDAVVVMSACPNDILDINGKKPMVAHFVVERPSKEDEKAANEHDAEAQRIMEKARLRTESERASSSRPASSRQTSRPTVAARQSSAAAARSSAAGAQQQPGPVRQNSGRPAPRKLGSGTSSQASVPKKETQRVEESPPPRARQPPPRAGRPKPRKLERRTSSTPAPRAG